MRKKILKIGLLFLASLIILSCQTFSGIIQDPKETPTNRVDPTKTPTAIARPAILPGEANSDEPVLITGSIPYTSPFFLNTISEPFVLLEDQAGFIYRDYDFEFPLQGQVIGPVEVHADQTLTYQLALPVVPQGTFVDLDNNGGEDTGVQVFAVAYWSNTWGDPFLEPRDGTGWSTAYASTLTDPEQNNEITGGVLLVWAPDERQSFPIGFGEDGKLFTEDDPTAPIPAGYNLVDLGEEPFRIFKEAQPEVHLNEGEIAVNDYSKLSYSAAFDAMFEKVSVEYPFTQEKGIDWAVLYEEFAPKVAGARSSKVYYQVIRDFTYAIPDAHIGVSFQPEVFFEERGGSFGMVLAELSDGSVIVTQVLPDTPADTAGIEVGARILNWEGEPITTALEGVNPYLGPYSTMHHKRLEQLIFLTRVSPETRVTFTAQNPGENQAREVALTAVVEYDSFFNALPYFSQDELVLPIEGRVLEDSGLAYVRLTSFSADYRLLAKLWEHYLDNLIDNEIPGLIIDLRVNSGGSGGLANDFAGFFFDEELIIARRSYYSHLSGMFEYREQPSRIRPAPSIYEGQIAVLVGPYCISACEGFAYALKQGDRAILVGHYPTAGAYGEVGRGQYKLPAALTLQFPTGRPETLDGQLLIEGQGVPLDITVPVTEDSVLGRADPVLEAAIQALLEQIK